MSSVAVERSSRPGRGRRSALWAALAVGLVVALFVGVLATRQPTRNITAPSPLEGKAAPPIEGTALDGSAVRLSDLEGRYVLVNFFATWCVPCQQEHPELLRFSARHAETADASVLQVIFDHTEEQRVRDFAAKNGVNWPVVDGQRGRVAVDYGVRGVPESFLVNRDGFVLKRINGQVTADGLDELLRQADAAGVGGGQL